VSDKIETRPIELGQIAALHMFPEVFDDHGSLQTGYVFSRRAGPERPLCWGVPPVPEVSPSLTQVVLEAVLIYVVYCSIIDFAGGQECPALVVEGYRWVLVKMNSELLNEN